MANLLRSRRRPAARSADSLSLEDWAAMFTYGGGSYLGMPGLIQTFSGNPDHEEIPADFQGFAEGLYKRNGVVFACMLVRQLLFSEARFQFRRMSNGRPGDLFGTADLAPLETPWPNATTGDLLTRAIQDADLAGNFYGLRRSIMSTRITRMRPDWVTIVLGSHTDPTVQAGDLDVDIVGYMYHPGGRSSGRDPITLQRDQVCHFAPIPDPTATFRGMSWLSPVLRELIGDNAATTHKQKFYENGATPNMIVKLDPAIRQEAFDRWIAKFRSEHEGVRNAYKTLYLGGGADATVVGSDFRQLDFKVVQGHGETRIAAAAGVPPVIVGLSEGLEAATYSNYAQARRRFADGTMRPLWRNFAGSVATLINVPAGAQLWYDDRDIPFLAEDQKDAAEIQQTNAITIKTLVDAGFQPTEVVAAVTSGDFSKLQHTGLFSVQLQPAGSQNANGTPPTVAASAELRDRIVSLLQQ